MARSLLIFVVPLLLLLLVHAFSADHQRQQPLPNKLGEAPTAIASTAPQFKRNVLCKGNTVISGFAPASNGTTQIAFMLSLSRHDPKSSPTVLYASGGPGASGITRGLSGPAGCQFVPTMAGSKFVRTTRESAHPNWNEHLNILFLEHPVGTGFSYTTNASNSAQWDSKESAREVYEMYAYLRQHIEEIRDTPTHFSLISYGGKFVTEWANYFTEPGRDRLGLNSVSLSNGFFGAWEQFDSALAWFCGRDDGRKGEVGPFVSEFDCTSFAPVHQQCKDMRRFCMEGGEPNGFRCQTAKTICYRLYQTLTQLSGRAVFDYTVTRLFPSQSDARGPYEGALVTALRSPELQGILGFSDGTYARKFEMMSEIVEYRHSASGDFTLDRSDLVRTGILDRGLDMLWIQGKLDASVCNYEGARNILTRLKLWKEDSAKSMKQWRDMDGFDYMCSKEKGAKFCYLELAASGHETVEDEALGFAHLLEQFALHRAL